MVWILFRGFFAFQFIRIAVDLNVVFFFPSQELAECRYEGREECVDEEIKPNFDGPAHVEARQLLQASVTGVPTCPPFHPFLDYQYQRHMQ